MKNILKKAYTLTEIVIVMLIIAVVVAISIKLTKAKLDNITSYTYYTAYNTVRAVAAEMLKDFNPEEDDYGITEPQSVALRIKNFFASNFTASPAFGTSVMVIPCPKGCYRDESGVCQCKLPVEPVDPVVPVEPVGPVDPVDPVDPSGSCPAVTPCGKECNASTGFVLRDISGFSRTCSDAGKQWSEAKCDCIPTPQTVSRNGEGFCRLFVNYTNTARLEEDDECKGDAISTNETDFADKDPDMILRNGMILYNVSQDPEHIALLAGNSKGVKFTDSSGRVIDVDEWGYTLYIDIDGARNGQGRLWEDVYPFYVTLSGTVIPAYDAVNPELSGGDSSLHLQTSVYDEFVDGNGRHIEWITKSRPFKDSACIMGYVNPAAPYCQGVPANAQCAQENHDCRLKTVMPVKFFGH